MRHTKYYAQPANTKDFLSFFFQSSIPCSMLCGGLLCCCFYWKTQFSILKNCDTAVPIERMEIQLQYSLFCGYTTTANHLWFHEFIMRLRFSQEHHDNYIQFQSVVIVNNLFIPLERWILNDNGAVNIITCFLDYPSWEVFPLIYC